MLQFFYLGCYLEGIIDVLLTLGWIYYFIVGEPLITTIRLLTGSIIGSRFVMTLTDSI